MKELKSRITKSYTIYHNQWIHNEDDTRKHHEVSIDFAIRVTGVEAAPLKMALDHTNHLLAVLLSDPLVQKDQKAYIEARLVANKQILLSYHEEMEVSRG